MSLAPEALRHTMGITFKVTLEHGDARLGTSRGMDAAIVRHLSCAKELTLTAQHWCIATDKAHVHGLEISNAILILPDNSAIVMPPQIRNAIAARIISFWVHAKG